MHLIATHENSDFDALAASVAAQRLSPGARIGLARRLARPVREYWSLHKDRFEAERVTAIDPASVDRLTIVDLRDRRRMKHLEGVLARRDAGEPVALHVWDHHPATPTDVTGDEHHVEPLGAVTTALVERLRAEGVSIDGTEATLFGLGIHADTGQLTLSHTTPRDVRAFAWLLERGADLSMIERYLHLPFAPAQLEALAAVLGSARRETVGGVDVALAELELDDGIDGLAEITAEARRLGGFDALLTVTHVRDKDVVQVVARSRSALVDVGTAMRAIGGGGHRGAAAAVVKGADDTGAVARELLEGLRRDPPRPRTVGEVMSTPVHTLGRGCTLDEAGARLRAWGVSGAPVVDGDEMVGVLSIRDVARAEKAGRGALPVASHMSGTLRTTRADVPLKTVLERMVTHDVGRLPVLDGETLVGIVTRTDVRRGLYATVTDLPAGP